MGLPCRQRCFHKRSFPFQPPLDFQTTAEGIRMPEPYAYISFLEFGLLSGNYVDEKVKSV